jgi:hypothetical protein
MSQKIESSLRNLTITTRNPGKWIAVDPMPPPAVAEVSANLTRVIAALERDGDEHGVAVALLKIRSAWDELVAASRDAADVLQGHAGPREQKVLRRLSAVLPPVEFGS